MPRPFNGKVSGVHCSPQKVQTCITDLDEKNSPDVVPYETANEAASHLEWQDPLLQWGDDPFLLLWLLYWLLLLLWLWSGCLGERQQTVATRGRCIGPLVLTRDC